MDTQNKRQDFGKDFSGQQSIEDIINGMYDWVRVINKNDEVIYINKAMAHGVNSDSLGKKCFEILGRDGPCENCISRKAIFNGEAHQKEEVIDGRTFSVMSSPVKDQDGDVIAVVEVLRDITQMKEFQQKILEQNQKLQYDLKIARKLQCSLLPKDLPEDKIKFSFIYKPCQELGGDFLDIFKIDEDHVGVYVADVSGHGVPASMLTVFLRSTMNKKVYSPSHALTELYTAFNDHQFDEDLYITVFYAIINLKDKKVIFCNAGHNVCPVILRESSFQLMKCAGIPISNWLEEPGYSDHTFLLQEGDKVLFSTDGIIEIRNREGEQFGEDRILEILLTGQEEPKDTLNTIVRRACDFAGFSNSSEIPDDITMALLEIK